MAHITDKQSVVEFAKMAVLEKLKDDVRSELSEYIDNIINDLVDELTKDITVEGFLNTRLDQFNYTDTIELVIHNKLAKHE